ncbi:hypothetical protein WK53_29645 [Burkholderia ubonensis]|uniref:Uncharacterized protein n=1 Tax=Burkholderia ubonensis TaxID=101571 RepID=A0AAW3NIG3_9BURK|nr:hypothetical protein WK53_29645 [Burkholderia ubonensis]
MECPDSAAFEIAKKVGGDIFVSVFLAGLILAQFASGISAQASVGRLLYAMGRDEMLPRHVFGYIHPKFRTPALNIAFAGIVGLNLVYQLRRIPRVHVGKLVRNAQVLPCIFKSAVSDWLT